MITQIALNKLKPNPALLAIRKLDKHAVSRYAQAMRTGAQFPPIVIKSGTRLIVSGHHRHAAYLQALDAKVLIPVREMVFTSEKDMITFAVQDNIEHGVPLTMISRKLAARRLTELGATAAELSALFRVNVQRIDHWEDGSVLVCGRACPVKHGLEHLAGTRLRKADYADHIRQDVSVTVRGYADQIMRWLDRPGWIDLTDDRNLVVLAALARKITDTLPRNLVIKQHKTASHQRTNANQKTARL